MEDLTEPRVAVVTGASSGIGLAAAEELARRGWSVALVGRDPGRLAAATERVRTAAAAAANAVAVAGAGAAAAAAQGHDDAELPGKQTVRSFQCDFAVLDDVRTLAAALRAAYPRIHVLANNAGGTVPTRRTTVDGHEATIQTNHLAPFLLSNELREPLRGGRIINTASAAHTQGALDAEDLSMIAVTYRIMRAYGSAKQANILFAAEAARRWPDIISTSYHPGIVRTRFGHDSPLYAFFYRYVPGLRTAEHGARTLVWLATADPAQIRSGAYYMNEGERRAAPKATDTVAAKALWEASCKALGL